MENDTEDSRTYKAQTGQKTKNRVDKLKSLTKKKRNVQKKKLIDT